MSFFLIKNVSIVDGTGRVPTKNQSLLVDHKTISWFGPTEAHPAIDPAHVIDGSGHTLLPGLINCHVHLSADGNPDLQAQVRNDTIPLATLRGAKSALRGLYAGVTSVRDCGAANDVAIELGKAITQGAIVGPRVKAAGRVITMTGGHGYFIGVEADGHDAVTKATRAEIKRGAHFIKVMATGGVLTEGVSPLQTAYMPEELLAVAREAHNAGRRVATHAIGSDGIKNALRAGIDSIEHGIYLDDEALDLAVASGAYLVPTLSAVNQIANNGTGGAMPSWVVAKAEMVMQKQRESFKAAVDSGMRIAAGTDAGTPFNRHEDFWMEMKLLVEYGLTPLQAITASTKSAAENMDSVNTVGTIEIGKIADLILVEGDPTQDISVMEKVKLVVKDGEIYRDEISDPLLHSSALPQIALF